jgi:hypothetical protein
MSLQCSRLEPRSITLPSPFSDVASDATNLPPCLQYIPPPPDAAIPTPSIDGVGTPSVQQETPERRVWKAKHVSDMCSGTSHVMHVGAGEEVTVTLIGCFGGGVWCGIWMMGQRGGQFRDVCEGSGLGQNIHSMRFFLAISVVKGFEAGDGRGADGAGLGRGGKMCRDS